MGKQLGYFLWTVLVLTTACDVGSKKSQGHRGGDLPNQPLGDTLGIVTQWPQDQENQVALAASVALRLDGVVNAACLEDNLNFIEEATTNRRVHSGLHLVDEGRTLVIDPQAALKPETWYVCHISPLLCDLDGRLFEENYSFSFYTRDETSPKVTQSSLSKGATGVSRDVQIKITFSELLRDLSVSSDSVILEDDANRKHPIESKLIGNDLYLKMVADLLGGTHYTLRLLGGQTGATVTDRFGNSLANTWSIDFWTASDNQQPQIHSIWPRSKTDISPKAQPLLTFSESMDLNSIESSAFTFMDQYGSIVTFAVKADLDRKVLRLVPTSDLLENRRYTIQVHDGPGSITDPAGNNLLSSKTVYFDVRNDSVAPTLQTSVPEHGQAKASPNILASIRFSEPLDTAWVNEDTVSLADENGPLTFTLGVIRNDSELLLQPTGFLEPSMRYVITLEGGHTGLRDPAGNYLAEDVVIAFSTSADSTLPQVVVSPTNGHSAVPPEASFSAAFDEPLDPNSVGPLTVQVLDKSSTAVPGKIQLSGGDRIIAFVPDQKWDSGEWYSVTLTAGPGGLRERSGNWLTESLTTWFRIAHESDVVPPEVTVSLNATNKRRKADLTVPPHAFTVMVQAEDPVNYDFDLASVEILIAGPGKTPSPAAILAGASISKEAVSYQIRSNQALAVGEYTLSAKVADLAGNVGNSATLKFRVADLGGGGMPFPRTQVVWVRFDLDRDSNGRQDFEDDLYKLGFLSPNDPVGTNARMAQILKDGVLGAARESLHRKPQGGRLPTGSVPLLLTEHQPFGMPYSQMACGGLDPSGSGGRDYGSKSTGILGRAMYDYLNADKQDTNTTSAPALGVFAGELFLFEAETHLSLYPVFVTTWAKRFMYLVDDMGGVAAGQHRLDRRVIAKTFNYVSSNRDERERYLQIFNAADDWATAIGIILAHEIGHSVGLVASGPNPAGLHGDITLHNSYPMLGDVMASAVGYDALVSLKYRFRDLNVAYLRQRILLK